MPKELEPNNFIHNPYTYYKQTWARARDEKVPCSYMEDNFVAKNQTFQWIGCMIVYGSPLFHIYLKYVHIGMYYNQILNILYIWMIYCSW